MKENLMVGLTPEQIEKIKACKGNEEILKLAKEEGVELNEEQLEAVSGGICTPTEPKCKQCKSNANVVYDGQYGGSHHFHCTACDYWWMSSTRE